MDTIWFYIQDYIYWIIHCVGLYIVWDISNNKATENSLLNTPISYFLIGVFTTQIATWFDKMPKG